MGSRVPIGDPVSSRFDRENGVKGEVEQLSRLVFPPFAGHHLPKPSVRYGSFAGLPEAKSQRRQRILFIEDDRFIADMYRMGLESGGWDVDIAVDGDEGLRRALEDPPALILLDLLLPRMDGIELLRQVRQNPATRNVPVLIVSNASGLGGRDEEARRLGIEDWMVKANTTPAVLARRVGRILTAQD